MSYQTVQGRLAADPEYGTSQDKGTSWARIIILATDRYRDHHTGDWVDGPTTRYRAVTFGRLAENLANSLHKGDPVVVTGTVTTTSYRDNAGDLRTSHEMRADTVAVDLSRCTATAHRNARTVDDTDTADLTEPQD